MKPGQNGFDPPMEDTMKKSWRTPGPTLEEFGYFEDSTHESLFEAQASSDAIAEAVGDLRADGISIPTEWWTSRNLVLIAEAVNWAAKAVDEDYYAVKHRLINALVDLNRSDIKYGWNNGVFAMFHPEVGTVWFHDPFGVIEANNDWPYAWSGVERQAYAFDTLAKECWRRYFASQTTPVELLPSK